MSTPASRELPSTGNPVLDADHREILALLDHVQAAMAANDVPRLRDVAGALVTRIADHFAREEEVMWALHYPNLVRHKDAHDLLLGDAARFHDEVQQLGATPVTKRWVETRLHDWFVFHTVSSDVALAAFMAGRATSAAPATGSTASSLPTSSLPAGAR